MDANRKHNDGYLIIELLLAMLVAAMGFVFLNQMLTRSVRLQHDSAWEARAAEFGYDVISHIRAGAMQEGAADDIGAWDAYWHNLEHADIPLALGGAGEWRAWGAQEGIETNAAVYVTGGNGTRHPVELWHKGYNDDIVREPFTLWYELEIEPVVDFHNGQTNMVRVELNLYKEEHRSRPRMNYYAEITRN